MTGPTDRGEPCCRDREILWLLDDLAVLGVYGGLIPATLLDQLPPARALLHTRLALEGSARLERGDLGDLVNAVHLSTIGGAAMTAPGWWSRYLTGKELSVPVTVAA